MWKWESNKTCLKVPAMSQTILSYVQLLNVLVGFAAFNTTSLLPLITTAELLPNNDHYWSVMTETAQFPHLVRTWPCSSKHPSLLLFFSSLSTSFLMSHNHQKGSGPLSPSLSFVFLPPISFRSSYASLPSPSPTGNLGKVGQNEIWPQ